MGHLHNACAHYCKHAPIGCLHITAVTYTSAHTAVTHIGWEAFIHGMFYYIHMCSSKPPHAYILHVCPDEPPHHTMHSSGPPRVTHMHSQWVPNTLHTCTSVGLLYRVHRCTQIGLLFMLHMLQKASYIHYIHAHPIGLLHVTCISVSLLHIYYTCTLMSLLPYINALKGLHMHGHTY